MSQKTIEKELGELPSESDLRDRTHKELIREESVDLLLDYDADKIASVNEGRLDKLVEELVVLV